MTLATVSRYDPDRLGPVGDHAVVVGGSMSGLLAARILADGFERVTVVERDPMPDEPTPRDGAPHARQPHLLQLAGLATLEDVCPGYGEDLIAAGGLIVDLGSEFKFYDEGGFLADGPKRIPIYSASRPLYEHVLRQHVVGCDRVVLRTGCRFVDYRLVDGGTGVEGIVVRDGNPGTDFISADLVVDATGRTSRTPMWLREHGYSAPEIEEVHVDLAYCTATIDRETDARNGFWAPASAPRTRGGGALPIEGGRWQIVLHGVHGDDPPTDVEGFEAFAASLPIPHIKRLLGEHSLADEDIHYYPFPSNLRRRYEDLDRFPDGLVVIGDAIASYNPIYGQGMSVAALQALALHHTLAATGLEDLPQRFFSRSEDVIDGAWMLSIGADFGFPQTRGPKPRGTSIMNRYLSRLIRKAHTDGRLADAFTRVVIMERPASTLFRPGVLWRVLKPTG